MDKARPMPACHAIDPSGRWIPTGWYGRPQTGRRKLPAAHANFSSYREVQIPSTTLTAGSVVRGSCPKDPPGTPGPPGFIGGLKKATKGGPSTLWNWYVLPTFPRTALMSGWA